MLAVLQQSIMITSFVFVMMLIIEYFNVLTRGSWQTKLRNPRLGRYLFAAFMGFLPGCLGAFTVVSLYGHGVVTLGAVVTTMIATSGDEAYFMIAMIPRSFLVISAVLLPLGILAGWLTDAARKRGNRLDAQRCDGLVLHDQEERSCFTVSEIVPHLKRCKLARGSLCTGLGLIVFLLLSGQIGPPQWNWVRITFLSLSLVSLLIVVTVPDHFLEAHLRDHVVRRHLPRVFLWTLGTLGVLAVFEGYVDLQDLIRTSPLIVMLLAVAVGIIPESGPHLVFITLFAQGTLPLSVLLANSAVQDGHGMLPMLAQSRQTFLLVKAINVIFGLVIGFSGYFGGW